MTDVLRLLSEANPVRLEEVPQMSATLPDSILGHHRRPSRRLVLAAAVAAALAASLVGVFAFGSGSSPSPTSRSSSPGLGTEDTVASASVEHPLALGAKVVALSDAAETLGPGLVLPDSSLVGPRDLGPVWMYSNPDGSNVAVALTFPKQRMFIQYLRPQPEGGADLAAVYRDIAREDSHFHLIDLNGVVALAADQNSDDTGHNFGVVAFPMSGDEIRVFGHYDQATLQQVAQSILDRTGSSSSSSSPPITAEPGVAPTPVANAADADALLPFSVVLPSDGSPSGLAVLKPGHQLIAYFDTPAQSPYELVEGPTNLKVADLQAEAKAWKVGRARIVAVDDVHVLVQTEHVSSVGNVTTVSWIRGDGATPVLSWIQGPEDAANGMLSGQTFTEQQALAAAADIIAQGG